MLLLCVARIVNVRLVCAASVGVGLIIVSSPVVTATHFEILVIWHAFAFGALVDPFSLPLALDGLEDSTGVLALFCVGCRACHHGSP